MSVPKLPQLEDFSAEECVVDHRSEQGPEVLLVRGSLLVSAIDTLKSCGHFERYLAKLPASQHDAMLYTLAMSWLPLAQMLMHCQACDELSLSDAELVRLGSASANSIAHALLGSLLRTTGMSPLTALSAYGRVYDRLFQGGGCMVLRTGPKDLRLEHLGNPLGASRYHCLSTQGFYKSVTELFAKRAYVKAARTQQPGASFAIEISWV